MDPVKKSGQVQEQIEMEYKSRRIYPKKWSKFYQDTPWKEMYNQDRINEQLKTGFKDDNPFKYSNEGDSYFISPEMHKSLVAVCRCGRPRSGLHVLKCLQNQQTKYLKETHGNETCNLPETSNGFVGWQNQQPRYKQWESSTKYVSPLYDMPGERITTHPYNAIIIG